MALLNPPNPVSATDPANAEPRGSIGLFAPFRRLFGTLFRNFVFRSVLQALFTIWLTLTVTFFLVRLLPSNPIDLYIEELQTKNDLTREQAEARASAMFINADFDKPIAEQYLGYLGKVVRLNLGESVKATGTQVTEIIAAVLPWTLFCVGLGLLLSFMLGLFLGTLMAYFRNTPFDAILTTLCSYLNSVPNYLIAILIVYVFGVQLQWFSVAAARDAYTRGSVTPGFNLPFILDVLAHAALPIITYLLATVGGWALSMKNSTLGVLGEEYVNAANARGLTRGRIMTMYVSRNAALPLFTQLALSIGFIVGGSLIIEDYYLYPGVGARLLLAVRQRDYPVMQGIFLVISVSVILSNLLADFLYSRLDPRVRVEE